MSLMNIFESLPHVEKCCFCISLKIGSIIIVVIHIISVIEAILGSGISKDFNDCYSTGGLMKVLGYVAIIVFIAVLIAAIYFLVGIFKGIPNSAVWFMYASAFMLIFNVLVSILLMIEWTKKDCPPPYILGGATLLSAIMSCYFLIVIASYHRVMMYR